MKYITVFISFLLLFSCKEEYVGQFPIDSDAPQCVSNPIVENLNGSVKIHYSLPNETDILYVKAVYLNSQGEKKEVKTSIFKNELVIKGFGKSAKQKIQLITVDRSQNESEPLDVEIEPLDSPIYGVFESLKIFESWGGVKVLWENPLKEQIVLSIFEKVDNKEIEFETFYSTDEKGKGAVRGLDTIPRVFNVTIRDIYNNYTDTLQKELTPLFEIQLPSKEFKQLPLAPGYKESPWSDGWKALWDGKITDQSKYYLSSGAPQPYFTVDLGKVYRLSRTKIWGRVKYCYSLHNPKYFEIWGTTDANAVKDPSNWEGWTCILEGKSHKPSGEDSKTVTAEDRAYAENGEEYEFPDDVVPVRFIRFRCLETWTLTNAIHLDEWRLWGKEL